jgi:DNA-binding MarR family transcriptional regulator
MLVVFFVDTASFVSILALSNKYRGELAMLENQRSEKNGVAPAEKAAGDGPLMPLLGLAFWRMKHAFEREVGISAATSFLLSMLIEEDGISQGEVSRRFERLEADSLLSRERDPEDNRVVRLYATEKGRLLVESCQERRDGFEERIQGEFTFEELAEFRRALGVVTRLMEQ